MFPSATNIQHAPDIKQTNQGHENANWLKNESFPQNCTENEDLPQPSQFVKTSLSVTEICHQRKRKKGRHKHERSPREDNRKHSRRKESPKRSKDKKEQEKSKTHEFDDSSEDDKKKRKHGSKNRRKEVYENKKIPSIDNVSSEGTSFKQVMGCKTVWIEDRDPNTFDVYCVDKKANRNNLYFESVHFSEAAFYKRFGSSCLGLSNKQEINWNNHKQSKKSRKENTHNSRYFSKQSVKALNCEDNLLDLSKTNNKIGQTCRVAFISLEAEDDVIKPLSGFNSNEIDPLNIHDKATQHYLFGEIPESNQKDSVSAENIGDVWEAYITKQTADYNKMLRENPNDIKLWMRFVKFQDEIASRGHSIYFSGEIDDKRKKLSRLVLEKKIAILERAIATNPSSLELKLEHVELCMELWDSKQLREHWDRIIFQHPNDPVLWNAYIMFVQSQFSSFTFNKVLSVYGKCIGKLTSIMEGQLSTHTPLPNTDNFLLDIFSQLCEVIRQSGHTEKAVCCYQAMIEFNLFGSLELDASTPHNEQTAFLETFWDSEEAKFGEKGACGWNSWMRMKQKGGWKELPSSTETSDLDAEDEEIPESCSDNSQAWLYLETSREQRHFLPWKPDPDKGVTEEDCEDPERMVVFDDVSPFLFKIKSHELQFKLLLSFLRFLGVTVAPCGSTNDYEFHKHSMYAMQHPSQIFCKSELCSLNLMIPDLQNEQLSVGVINNCSPLEIYSLSSSAQTLCKPPRIVNKLKQFVRNVFVQSLPLFTELNRTNLLLIWIKFEYEQFSDEDMKDGKSKKKAFKQHCKDVRKFAKSVLKEEVNRNNLRLWEAYAKLEWKLGNVEEARRVIGTALGMSGQVSLGMEVNLEAIPCLVYSYANLELELDTIVRRFISNMTENSHINDSEVDRLLKVLTWLGQGSEVFSQSQVESDKPSGLEILKSRRGFQTRLEAKFETYKICFNALEMPPDLQYFVEYVCCYAWFQYITAGIKAATVVFEETLTTVKFYCGLKDVKDTYVDLLTTNIHKHYEDIFLNYIKLLIYHMLRNPTPLTIIRNILQRALLTFPRNAVFLQLFIALEMKSLIIGRVRRYFDSSLYSSASPVTWLYSIEAEMIREQMLAKSKLELTSQSTADEPSVTSTGVTHRIRSLFNKAVAERVARHNVLLWRLFIHFEVSCENLKKAKALFYRAVQHCPWAKVLYLDAARYFPDELQNILDILMEKDLHIRAPIEEIELLMKSKEKKLQDTKLQ